MAFELSTGTAAAALDGSERIGVLQGGAARAATVNQVKNFVGSTTLTGDVAGAGSGGISTTISPHAVGFSKFVPAPSAGLVGANAAGDYQHITIGTGLSLTAGVLAATGGGAGGLTDGDKGDVVVSGSGSVWTIDANAVTFAKHVAAPSGGIVGANAAGNYQHVTIGTGLSLSSGVLSCTVVGGGGGGVSDGDKGDIVISGTGTVYTIDANAVSFSKFAAAPSAGIVAASATGNYQHITLGSGLAFSGSTLTATGSSSIATRTALAALTGMAAGDVRDLTETGREGRFKYSTANLSTQVTNDPGQGIYVPPASASTGASGAWVRVWNDRVVATWFGATGDGSTNDTTALQRGINFVCFLGGGKMFLPAGVYSLGTSTLSLPAYALSTPSNPMKTVEIEGVAMADMLFGTAGTGYTHSTKETVIKTTATSGSAITVTASGGSFSQYFLVVRNLAIRTYGNPTVGGIDATYAANALVENVAVDVGVYSMDVAQPTSTTTLGIRLPTVNNSAVVRVRNVSVVGYYGGITLEEHSDVDGLYLTACYFGILVNPANHASLIGRVCAQNCTYPIGVQGSHYFTVDQLDLEHAASGWQQTLEDFRDVGNLARGSGRWSVVAAGVGQSSVFTQNGGSGFSWNRIGSNAAILSQYYAASNTSTTSGTDARVSFTKISGGSEVSLHSGDATKIDINSTGTYRVTFTGAFASNATGERVVGINHQHGSPDTVVQEAKNAVTGGRETGFSLTAVFTGNGGASEYIEAVVNQTSGGALNFLGGVNRSGVMTIEKLS